jgi:hypothetical protein
MNKLNKLSFRDFAITAARFVTSGDEKRAYDTSQKLSAL